MANGGSLTINPQTGLPEAGFLENLLPALAGFALNAFAPGIGGAVGGMLGLGQAAGTGIAIGGATALASGSLEKGLMAGLGAYGGAGIAGSLDAAGKTALEQGSGFVQAPGEAGRAAAAQATAPSSTFERMQAGLGSVGAAPMDALKNNAGYIAAAAAPGLLGAFDDQPTSSAPKIHPGYIRKYDRNPETGSLYQVSATPADQYTEGITFGGVPKRYDTGGVTFGGVGAAVDAQGNPLVANPQDTRSDSEKAQDYLSGKGPNPFLFYHKAPTVDPVAKAAEATKTLQEDIKEDLKRGTGGSGGSGDARGVGPSGDGDGGFPAGLAPAANTVAQALGDMGLNALSHAVSKAAMNGAMSGTGAAPQSSAAPSTGAVNSSAGGQYGGWGSRDAGGGNTGFSGSGAATGSSTGPAAGTSNSKDNGGWGSRDAGGGTPAGPSGSNVGATSAGSAPGASASSAAGGKGGGGFGEGSGAGRYGAQGGYLNNGRFDQRYADGGGVSGGGSLELHVPVSIGGGGGGGLGSLGGGNGIQQGGMRQPNPDFLQQQQQNLPGFQAMQKAQQDYTNSDEYKGFQNYAQQYQQNAGNQMAGAFGAAMGGARGGFGMAEGGITALADGGMYNLGSYSDGGRLLRGPGDGVSDDIPATIGEKQPARLADGEFVVPARIVSELGNGSTEAGARKLYAMMDRVQKSRSKTVGKDRVAANSRAEKYLPA
jgi:hypothetical protein